MREAGLDNKQVLTGSRSSVLQGYEHGVQHVAGLFSVETVLNSQKESKWEKEDETDMR
jgi:hypothetical protein